MEVPPLTCRLARGDLGYDALDASLQSRAPTTAAVGRRGGNTEVMGTAHLPPSSHRLLRESVLNHRPECLTVVDHLDERPLPEPAREELRDAVVAELCATGLDENDEPNQRGYELERLIDLLGRL